MSAPRKQHVSLRGASTKEVTRDALLEEISHQRELRNHVRRSNAAALCIQRVWRCYRTMKEVSAQLQDEWKAMVNHEHGVISNRWISSSLLRPFIFFVTLHQKQGTANIDCMLICFRILLDSINSTEPNKNFCFLTMGSPEEKNSWFYQSRKLASVCSFVLAEYDPSNLHNKDQITLTVLAMQLLVALTDPKGWRACKAVNIKDAEIASKDLIEAIISGRTGLFSCIRQHFMKVGGQRKSCVQRDDNFLITASAVTLALRPFHCVKGDRDHMGRLGVRDAVIHYFAYLLTVPQLSQCLPAVLIPALKHVSVLSSCLNVILISKEKVIMEMSELSMSNISSFGCLEIPCAAWALANIINLVTEYDSDAGGSTGHFIPGIDCGVYVHTVINIAENILDWVQCVGKMRKEAEKQGESFHDIANSDICGKEISVQSSLNLYVDLLKPVCQQWHLMKLLDVLKKDEISVAAVEKSDCPERPQLLSIVYFYSFMVRIYSSLNHFGGSLPVLNMLSFTPGFLVELWRELENFISSKISKDQQPDYGEISLTHNKVELLKRQGQVIKDENKWVTVLQKITGKSSTDVDLNHSLGASSASNQVVKETKDLWDVEPLRQGPQGISKDNSCLLYLFCAIYAHLLLVLDDIEFYQKQVPFTLEQQRSIAAMLNTFVYNSILHVSGVESNPLMVAAIRCLHLLYERDCRHKFCPSTLWLAPARRGRPPIEAAARAHEATVSSIRSEESLTSWSVIGTTPHVFPFEERVQMFREYVELDKVSRRMAGEVAGPGPGSIDVVVRRDFIVEDGFTQLNSLGSRLKSKINVSFVSECGLPEAGLDYGGLSKEFLTDLSKRAFASEFGLFSQTSTSERSLIPNMAARFQENGIQMIEFLGQVVGKALYEGILLDHSFSLVFVQKLLGRYSFLDELSALDPDLYRNLVYVKQYDGDVGELALDFTVTEEINGKRFVRELKSGGKSTLVTNDNKLQYVHAIADYKLNKQILPLANAFYRGLTDLISPTWLSLFNANEFNQLLSGGNHDFDVDDLRKNTRYAGGYSEGSRTVKLFWEVISGFEPKERCMLLKFVTSCSRAPLLGFKHLQPTFTIQKVPCDVPLWSVLGGQDVDRLPTASTCYNTLKLPTYKRSSTMKSKLLYAISSNTGFELS
ncbi:E3 ubiquitin-protein ligase UPL7 [Aristolochia californica]|uniref:E3 ubiquitin-protein ligase UPL7 n=1 Tax=Aristolochia californica TaxID=171875 RepID=UPI0035DE09EE